MALVERNGNFYSALRLYLPRKPSLTNIKTMVPRYIPFPYD